MNTQELYALIELHIGILTVTDLVTLAAKVFSPAARNLSFALLEAIRRNPPAAHRFIKKAEESCTDESELCYVLHVCAIILLNVGDITGVAEKGMRSLALCDRLSLSRLQAGVLSNMSVIYRQLGQPRLAAAYAAEALDAIR